MPANHRKKKRPSKKHRHGTKPSAARRPQDFHSREIPAKTPVNREYRSSLFAWIFSDKEAALSLYNSMNGTSYDDPDALEFTTLENVVYMGMKNDVSFLVGCDMNLYEHQSTWNPNMPLRGLFYYADVYKGYIASRNLDVYSSTRLRIPAPKYVIFYNGTKEEPESMELRLSELYGAPSADGYALECTAQVLNINFGRNRALMEQCRELYEYAYFINAIQRRLREGVTREAAVDEAIEECIAGNILTEFLTRHRAEVTNVILEEYDEEQHMRTIYQEGRLEGRQEGLQEGYRKHLIQSTLHLLKKGYTPADIAELLNEELHLVEQICSLARVSVPEYEIEKIISHQAF